MCSLSPELLAGLLPDTPGRVDLRGLLLSGRCDVWAEDEPLEGFVVRSWDFPFGAVFGRPDAAKISQAMDRGMAQVEAGMEAWSLLAEVDQRDIVGSALSGWRRRRVVIHRWQGKLVPPPGNTGCDLRLLPEGHRDTGLSFEAFTPASRSELAKEWVEERPMAVAVADSLPVAYCYAAFVTESLWDVAIETVAPWRRRGLGRACFLRLAGHMAELGKTPTWGSMMDNPASLNLAQSLGFVHDAALDSWQP